MRRFMVPRVSHCKGGCILWGPEKQSGPQDLF